MGGRIKVGNTKGSGSTFTIVLDQSSDQPSPAQLAGESTSIRGFMRLIGVPARSRA
jgi:hypothetical protein